MKERDVFSIIKLLYIIILICALFALREALGLGSQYINEEYLRPICDSIFAINGVLTAFFIIFRERIKICTKWWFSIHTFYEYSSFFWIIFCQVLFLKNKIFYDLIFGKWVNQKSFLPLFHTLFCWKVESFSGKSRVFHIFH